MRERLPKVRVRISLNANHDLAASEITATKQQLVC